MINYLQKNTIIIIIINVIWYFFLFLLFYLVDQTYGVRDILLLKNIYKLLLQPKL